MFCTVPSKTSRLPSIKKALIFRPILRNKKRSSSVTVSKSVGSSAGERNSWTFAKAFSAFATFVFAKNSFLLKFFKREACFTNAKRFISFSLCSSLSEFPHRDFASVVSARVPATRGLLNSLGMVAIEADAFSRANSSSSC
uniref:Uncharacterized protein n=1 Tax=Arundo donax TaxID=35708 RepID=A0A0A9CXQ0_ARUDO